MSSMSRQSFLRAQLIQTDRMLELAGDHPLMAPGLRQHKAEMEEELRTLPAVAKQPRTVLFFSGQPVAGSIGIDAEFAAKVLEPFLEMVKTQYAATKHGKVGARGPRRDESEARLLLTGLPRGSFGLELSQPEPSDLFSGEQLSNTLVRLTEVIKSAGDSDEGFAAALEDVSPRVFTRLKDFFSVIAENQADLRLVSGDLECRLDRAKIATAVERAGNLRTVEQPIEKSGVFRGATLDSWRFDFRLDDGETVSGRLGEDVSDANVEAMLKLTNQPCVAKLRQTTVTTQGGAVRTRYELLELAPRQQAAAEPA